MHEYPILGASMVSALRSFTTDFWIGILISPGLFCYGEGLKRFRGESGEFSGSYWNPLSAILGWRALTVMVVFWFLHGEFGDLSARIFITTDCTDDAGVGSR
jgi:hypothetical protein